LISKWQKMARIWSKIAENGKNLAKN